MTTTNNMKFSVSNYGPIAEAKDIELRPLTVFVGPSNTGKSYLAVLVHAWFNFNRNSRRFSMPRLIRYSHRKAARQASLLAEPDGENIDNSLTEFFNFNDENILFSELPEELQQWANKKIAEEVNREFHQEISRCMGTSLKEDHLAGNGFKFNFEDARKKLTLGSLDTTPSMKIKKLDFDAREVSRFRRYLSPRKELPNDIKREMFIELLSEKVFDFHYRTTESLYLPAARTGIMQSLRAIAGALVQRATYAGFEEPHIPTLSGVLSDFIGGIIFLDTSRRTAPNVRKVADMMETDILHGSIKVESSEATQYPQFLYKQKWMKTPIPLLRSSSMVLELAPVVLFLRHRVGEGDLLIIEEPESHLHPAAQKNIAKAIVHLIRVGVRVMVTTHSDYFLEQLANHVRSTKLKEREDKKLTGTNFLQEKEIGAYVFKQRKKGTIVKKLDFDNESGLSPKDHDKVSSDLYNETVEILDKLDQQDRK